jgi:hypothetical protein
MGEGGSGPARPQQRLEPGMLSFLSTCEVELESRYLQSYGGLLAMFWQNSEDGQHYFAGIETQTHFFQIFILSK